jgi:hypothetical protein
MMGGAAEGKWPRIVEGGTPVPEQWEYKILTARVGNRLRDEAGAEHGEFNESGLNSLGKEGWQVCGYDWSGLNVHTVILKRSVRPFASTPG